jgi:predicted small secreted protein
MKKFNLSSVIALLIFMSIFLSSCAAIAGIFKAGVWVGVIVVVVIIIIIFWLISKAGKK